MDSTASAYHRPNWYAVYTRSRHEKKVAEVLSTKGITHFLPLRETVHRWKDRRKIVQVPLFSGYVFVQILLADKLRVLKIEGVVRIVSFDSTPTPIPDQQIEAIKTLVDERLNYDPYPYLTEGQWVKVVSGPMKDVQGILVRRRNKFRLVLSVDLIGQSVALEIDSEDVQSI